MDKTFLLNNLMDDEMDAPKNGVNAPQ